MRRFVGSTQPTATSGVSRMDTTLGGVDRSGAMRVATESEADSEPALWCVSDADASSASVAGVDGKDNEAVEADMLTRLGVDGLDARPVASSSPFTSGQGAGPPTSLVGVRGLGREGVDSLEMAGDSKVDVPPTEVRPARAGVTPDPEAVPTIARRGDLVCPRPLVDELMLVFESLRDLMGVPTDGDAAVVLVCSWSSLGECEAG